jgi:peptide/nickel transport system substrate-binding protein
MVIGAELPSFATKPLAEPLPNPRAANAKVVLNATLVYLDERALPRTYLASALPEIDTESWRLYPDGRMETIYRLKANLSWHDQQPLTAQDFVFAWRVYSTPEFGVSNSVGLRLIQEVIAPDPLTILIQWKDAYTEAAQLYDELPPLPRHILEPLYQERQGDSFVGLPHWTSAYVGAGPWRLERREPGAFFEASAFDGFVFGRPKIDRVRVLYQPDPNVVVATLLSGEAHISGQAVLHGDEGITLEQAWAANGSGKVLWTTDIGKGQEIQQRPEFAVPGQLASDVRLRQALAFAFDKVELTNVVTAGHGLVRDIFSHPNAAYYDVVQRAVPTRYPYDPRRAEQLLQQAGFSRGTDGFWLAPSGDRLTLEQWYLAGATNERDSQILVDSFRRLGIDASSNVWGIQRSSNEERVKTSGLFGGSLGTGPPIRYHSREIARAENRWTGTNRFGFANAEMDQLIDAYLTTLDRPARIQQLAQMERIAMEQLPAIPTYWTAMSNASPSRPNAPGFSTRASAC